MREFTKNISIEIAQLFTTALLKSSSFFGMPLKIRATQLVYELIKCPNDMNNDFEFKIYNLWQYLDF